MGEEKFIYDWDTFFTDAKQLANLLKDKDFKSLLVVTRGGMFLGGLLSEYLGIKIVETIGLSSYDKQNIHALIALKSAKMNLNKSLIVDDICDTGNTLKFLIDKYKAPTVALFYKPTAIVKPDYYLHETNQWVSFPWEVTLQ